MPCLRGLPPQTPFSASRQLKAAEQGIYARNPSPRTRPAGRLVRVVTPVPGCRVSLLVSRGDGVKGKRGGNRNPPISPCPAERVPPPASQARNPSPPQGVPLPPQGVTPSPDLQESHQKTPFCPVIIITYPLQVITCHSCRKIVVRASLPPIRLPAPIPRPPTDGFRFLL